MYDGFTAAHRGGSGTPLVLLHGFTDTWRTWDLVLPELERHHDVLAPTFLGHAGADPISGELDTGTLADHVERQMDDAGFETAHIAGNSLGGYLALQLASRGRARSVVAFAPAGGWAKGDESYKVTLGHFTEMKALLQWAAPNAAQIVSTPEGRSKAAGIYVSNPENIPPELLAHQIQGAAECDATEPLIAHARQEGWPLDASKVECPVRFVWGTEDQILRWPNTASRFRQDFPTADWIELDGVGHCPQLDVPTEAAQLIAGFARA